MKTLATPGLICLSTVMCVAQSGEKLLNQLDSEQLAAITKRVTQPALTDDQVNAAIVIGASDKDKAGSDIGITLDDVAQKWANVLNADTKSAQHSGFGVRLFSPSAWVAWNAHEAKRKYMNYASADVGASDRLQVLRIIVTPDTPTQVIAGRGMASWSSVEHVVVRSTDKKDATQPLLTVPYQREAKNAMGGNMMYNGVVAIFKMDEVSRLRAGTDKGEFLVTVVGENGKEKTFKLKQKKAGSFDWNTRPSS